MKAPIKCLLDFLEQDEAISFSKSPPDSYCVHVMKGVSPKLTKTFSVYREHLDQLAFSPEEYLTDKAGAMLIELRNESQDKRIDAEFLDNRLTLDDWGNSPATWINSRYQLPPQEEITRAYNELQSNQIRYVPSEVNENLNRMDFPQ